MEIIVKSGGKAFGKIWDPEKREYEYPEVTDRLEKVLKFEVKLEEDVTLLDIFKLASNLKPEVRVIFNTWFDEFIEEALTPAQEPFTDVEYMELYRHIHLEEYDGIPEPVNLSFPSFHGIGLPDAKGQRTPYAVWLSPLFNYVHLPLKLRPDVEIYQGSEKKPKFIIPAASYTLWDVLFGIFWEISFSGGPKERDEFAKSLGKEDAEETH